jgi:hypothetical protein
MSVIINVNELLETALYNLQTGRRQMKNGHYGVGSVSLMQAEEQLQSAMNAMAQHAVHDVLETIRDPRLNGA